MEEIVEGKKRGEFGGVKHEKKGKEEEREGRQNTEVEGRMGREGEIRGKSVRMEEEVLCRKKTDEGEKGGGEEGRRNENEDEKNEKQSEVMDGRRKLEGN